MADFRYLLAIYVHAHQTGNSVPPHIDAAARAALAASPATDEPAVPHQGGREPAAVNNDSIELRVQGMSAWQHIDTAPMDGTEILASDYDAIEIVSWKVYGSASNWESRYGDVMFPAWWQPLADHPPIPQPLQGGEVE